LWGRELFREGNYDVGEVLLVKQGALHVDISQQHELIHNDTAKEDGNDHDRHLCQPKMAMQT